MLGRVLVIVVFVQDNPRCSEGWRDQAFFERVERIIGVGHSRKSPYYSRFLG